MVEYMLLPEKSQFRKNGIFSQSNLRANKPIPVEILHYVFPSYLTGKHRPIKKKQLELLLEYCIFLKKVALKEDREHRKLENKTKEVDELQIYEDIGKIASPPLPFPTYNFRPLPFSKASYNLRNVNSK
jgi:hypothetical protein